MLLKRKNIIMAALCCLVMALGCGLAFADKTEPISSFSAVYGSEQNKMLGITVSKTRPGDWVKNIAEDVVVEYYPEREEYYINEMPMKFLMADLQKKMPFGKIVITNGGTVDYKRFNARFEEEVQIQAVRVVYWHNPQNNLNIVSRIDLY